MRRFFRLRNDGIRLGIIAVGFGLRVVILRVAPLRLLRLRRCFLLLRPEQVKLQCRDGFMEQPVRFIKDRVGLFFRYGRGFRFCSGIRFFFRKQRLILIFRIFFRGRLLCGGFLCGIIRGFRFGCILCRGLRFFGSRFFRFCCRFRFGRIRDDFFRIFCNFSRFFCRGAGSGKARTHRGYPH